MSQTRKPLVVLLATPETSASVLYGLYEVLSSVGAVYDDMVVGIPGREVMDVRIFSSDGKPFSCQGNIPVEPHVAMNDCHAPDAVIVCDVYTSIYDVSLGRFPREIAWLRQMHAAGSLLTSVCSGSLLLAEAGLLDGHEATAHWAYREMFRRHYPKVSFRHESVLCLTAEASRIVTAGGVSAWHDLAIFLIGRLCGHQHAIETAKVFLISGHSDGQSPYSVMTRPMESTDALISDCLVWIAGNCAISKPVEQMVERSGLNARTFSRRFRSVTGMKPIEYVQALRVEDARQMLETGVLSVDDVGYSVGYEDPASFRRLFKRGVGLSPAAYRKKFQLITRMAKPLQSR